MTMAFPLLSISTAFFLFNVLFLAAPVLSTGVTVLTPLDDQLPLIARVGQSYSWPISNNTFGKCQDALTYTLSDTPSWLTFDPATRTFSGTPQESDEGDLDVSLTAHGCGSSASSPFIIPVSSNSPPTLQFPVSAQFQNSNPSLSSVFVVDSTSVLYTSLPALRIPPKWSFSIGFRGDTFTGTGNLYYYIRQADGSEIPSWMRYNPQEFTLEGVTPREDSISIPFYLNLVLHAADIKGATAATQAFDIILSPHEVCMTKPFLPTVNVTANAPFNVPLNSAADFSGVLADGRAFQPEDITELIVTSTGYPWMSYDRATRHLSGFAPSDTSIHPVLPVQLATIYNQSIKTNLSVALVPSFFSAEDLPPVVLGKDGRVDINFEPFFSNSTSMRPGDVDLSASPDPFQAGDFLNFDSSSAVLTGEVPRSFPSKRINVTITAYSHITHSTSHASLSLILPPSDHKNEDITPYDGPLSKATHAKLVLGLSIAFGVIGSVIALGVFLAVFRRCARVEDTALNGEEEQKAWSEKDRKWYGIDKNEDIEKSPGSSPSEARATKQEPYGGLGLRRVLERSHSDLPSDASTAGSKLQSPGVMSKREFMTRIRDTVRNVSDTYSRRRRPLNLNRPIIGKPILITNVPTSSQSSPTDPFMDSQVNSVPASFFTRSSTSTETHSIPERRTDCLSPRQPAIVHFADGGSSRDSIASVVTHAAEAVVHTASRASVRSAISITSDIQPSMRPRLVPFTSATRVPLPHMSVSSPTDSPDVRQLSLMVFGKSVSGDELTMGIHYVRALGVDRRVGPTASTLTVSTNVRSSFSSLESSQHGHGHPGLETVKMVARAGERFKFRVAIDPPSPVSTSTGSSIRRLRARLMTGDSLPRFLHADLNGRKNVGAVEFYGVPSAGDVGELEVGIFEGAVCVGRVDLEVIGR
ncbi:hypothetical protein BDZ89DRAFT_1107574 [Hymenopellis radicata]|nr:hypothetical protein BDZ89DRAFT_1107574 [Hymenopellis radicata]